MTTGRIKKIAGAWALLGLMAANSISAQTSESRFPSVRLAGVLGGKALLVIDNGPPKALSPGQTHDGIKLISVGRDQAVIEMNGAKESLRMGESPVGMVASSKTEAGAGSQRIVLQAGQGGHYYTSGQINGRHADFLVDTGATVIAMDTAHADALGISYRKGRMARFNTANGVITAYMITLDSVRIGSVTVYGVEASVSEATMNRILLGNSFLGRFDMQQSGGQLVLEKRY